jgi:hypothetical protein
LSRELTQVGRLRCTGDWRRRVTWISPEDKKKRTKGLRNAGVAFAMAKRGGPMKNSRDKRRAQKERRYEAEAD